MKMILIVLGAIAAGMIITIGRRKEKKDSAMQKLKQDREKQVLVRLITEKGGMTEPVLVSTVVKPDSEWKVILTEEQYKVARAEGTERAFCGIFHDNHKNGVYYCVGCGLPLFRSNAKFESGTGWPSFFQPIAKENIIEHVDRSYGMERTEIHCPRCGAHFGHVFEDGPAPTGQRYCMNSASLLFEEEASGQLTPSHQVAYFAAGCFWGVEEAFRPLKGVVKTAVGYQGGKTVNPTYQSVCSHATGHAEVVRVEFNPSLISYDHLLNVFWKIHNPTTRDRQGPDVGDQYRSAIFFTTPGQEAAARASVASLTQAGRFANPIVTEIELARPFYQAEEYHQQYALKHGGGGCALPTT